MAHKTKVNSTNYEIDVGKTRVGSTVYEITSGKTRVDGTIYEIEFAINLAILLVDFEYVKNDDGTATLTGWKGTLNGVTSTELVIPDDPRIIL